MKRLSLFGTLAVFTLGFSDFVLAADEAYGYRCDNCPVAWEVLHIDGNNCGGPDQSPVAISNGDSKKGKPSPRIRLNFGTEFVDPEETQTNYEWGADASSSTVRINGAAYTFNQFHFHTKSEHLVDGERSDLEMHFVNKTPGGATVVLAVFIESGPYNPAFAPITDPLPGVADAVVDLRALLPNKTSAYSYTGSTTTPPCSADIEWRLFKKPVFLSDVQIDAIRNEIFILNDGFDNNRPIQVREGRRIAMTKHNGRRDDDDDDDGDDDDDD